MSATHTVKVGFSIAEEVTDSTTEAAEDAASSAAEETEDAASSTLSLTSARTKAAEQLRARRAATRMLGGGLP